jgi:ammonia channel protein AmtB
MHTTHVSCYITRSLHTNVSLSKRVSTCHNQSTSTWTWRAELPPVCTWKWTLIGWDLSRSSSLLPGASQFFNIAVVAKTNRLTTSYIRDRKEKGLKWLFFVSGGVFCVLCCSVTFTVHCSCIVLSIVLVLYFIVLVLCYPNWGFPVLFPQL